ncbi:MAG: hypothetical protein V4469_00920 [Patescibacteria group bacterium]
MFTLHLSETDLKWSIVFCSKNIAIQSAPGLIIVPENQYTNKLAKLLKTYPDDCSPIFEVYSSLLNQKIEQYGTIPKLIESMDTKSSSRVMSLIGFEDLNHKETILGSLETMLKAKNEHKSS